MRWGPFQTGEIKESELSDIDNYERGIFLWSLLLVPTAYFWHPWFRVPVHIYKTLFFAYRTYYFSFDGASSCIAWAQQAPKVRVYVHVEGSRGMFPWKNWNLALLKSPAMSLHVFSTLYTSSEILSNFYHHSVSFLHNNLHFNKKKIIVFVCNISIKSFL